MSTAILEREAKAASIDNDLTNIAREAKAQFLTLAMRTAKGESLPTTEVQAACTAASRSVEAFAALVKTLRQRIDALAVIDAKATRIAAVNAHHARAANVMEEIKKLDADYRTKRKALSDSYIRADAEYKAASSAEQWAQSSAHGDLRKTAGDPDGDYRDLHNVKLD